MIPLAGQRLPFTTLLPANSEAGHHKWFH